MNRITLLVFYSSCGRLQGCCNNARETGAEGCCCSAGGDRRGVQMTGKGPLHLLPACQPPAPLYCVPLIYFVIIIVVASSWPHRPSVLDLLGCLGAAPLAWFFTPGFRCRIGISSVVWIVGFTKPRTEFCSSQLLTPFVGRGDFFVQVAGLVRLLGFSS